MTTNESTIWSNAWTDKIALANLGLTQLSEGVDFREALATAELTHEPSVFGGAITNKNEAKIALLEALAANQHGLINELRSQLS